MSGAVYLAWLLKLERDEHAVTRRQMDELGEKRLQLHVENVGLLRDQKQALDGLTKEIAGLRIEVVKRRRVG